MTRNVVQSWVSSRLTPFPSVPGEPRAGVYPGPSTGAGRGRGRGRGQDGGRGHEASGPGGRGQTQGHTGGHRLNPKLTGANKNLWQMGRI